MNSDTFSAAFGVMVIIWLCVALSITNSFTNKYNKLSSQNRVGLPYHL
jgi:hypothetical protein